jgi:hypothetical protein
LVAAALSAVALASRPAISIRAPFTQSLILGQYIDRGGISRGEYNGVEKRPHGDFLFWLKMAARKEAMKAPSERRAGLVMDGERGFGLSGGELVADGETTMGGILPSKLTVRSSAMIASSKPAHPD